MIIRRKRHDVSQRGAFEGEHPNCFLAHENGEGLFRNSNPCSTQLLHYEGKHFEIDTAVLDEKKCLVVRVKWRSSLLKLHVIAPPQWSFQIYNADILAARDDITKRLALLPHV